MRPIAAALFSISVLIALPAWAQDPQDAPATPMQSAFRLVSVSAYSAYYSTGLPTNSGEAFQSPIGSDVGLGANATISWIRNSERTGFSLSYTADYSGQVRYSSLDALNHMFSMTVTRHLTPRWDFDFTTATNVITADRLALLPDELPLPNQLPGATALVSPSLLLYGDRLLSSSAQMALSYSLSSRTSIAWRLGGTRYQSLSNNNSTVQTGVESPIAQSTTIVGGLQVSHSVSARTQVSMSLDSNRVLSGYLDTWYHRATLSLNRTLSQRWFMGVRGGGGYIQPSREIGNPSASLQYLAGGTLGYNAGGHTFQASIDRTVGDSYGFGATSTVVSSISWGWLRPGSPWSLRVSLNQQQLEGGGFGLIHTWLADTSLRRTLSRHTSISAEYGYMRYSGSTLLGTVSPNTVRLAMVWTPGLGLLP